MIDSLPELSNVYWYHLRSHFDCLSVASDSLSQQALSEELARGGVGSQRSWLSEELALGGATGESLRSSLLSEEFDIIIS